MKYKMRKQGIAKALYFYLLREYTSVLWNFFGDSELFFPAITKRDILRHIQRDNFNLPVNILNILEISLVDYKEKLGYLHKISENKNLTESAKKYLKITQEDFAMLAKILHRLRN